MQYVVAVHCEHNLAWDRLGRVGPGQNPAWAEPGHYVRVGPGLNFSAHVHL